MCSSPSVVGSADGQVGAGGSRSSELSPDRRKVIPHGLPHDPAIPDLQEPEHAVAQPSPAAVDVEGAADEPAGPDVLVDDEVAPVPSADRFVALMDRGGKHVGISASDRLASLDRVVGQADDVVNDGLGHRSEDGLEVAVVLGPQLRIDEPIKVRPCVVRAVLTGPHPMDDGPLR